MSAAPAFQFYATDWLRDMPVREMTYEERGVYIDLLAYAWVESGIPSDLERLRRLLHLSPPKFARVWEVIGPRWESDGNGRLVNPRQERERKKQDEWRRKSAKGGRASGKARAKQS